MGGQQRRRQAAPSNFQSGNTKGTNNERPQGTQKKELQLSRKREREKKVPANGNWLGISLQHTHTPIDHTHSLENTLAVFEARDFLSFSVFFSLAAVVAF